MYSLRSDAFLLFFCLPIAILVIYRWLGSFSRVIFKKNIEYGGIQNNDDICHSLKLKNILFF